MNIYQNKIKIIYFLLFFFPFFISFIYNHFKVDIIKTNNSYYENLEKNCIGTFSQNCCIDSVKQMEFKKAFLAKDNKCPKDYKRELLKCIQSYTWCEKIEKK